MENNCSDLKVEFPDIGLYSMDIPGGMALYLAHCDFYPFRSVVENNKIANGAIFDTYYEINCKARELGDFAAEEMALRNMSLHVSRVESLTYYSLLLTMVSLLEEAVNTLCRVYFYTYKLDKELEDIKGSGLERAAKYLKNVVKVDGFTSDSQWEYITTIRDARNMVVHNGGRLKKKDLKKYDKFGIGYHEEDKKLSLEYSDIVKMYEAIIEFMGRAFVIEPKLSD